MALCPLRTTGRAIVLLLSAVFCARALGNVNAADTTNAQDLWTGGIGGYNLTGAGVTVGVWEAVDGSAFAVRDTHQEFRRSDGSSRVTIIDAYTPGSYSSHGTHVAATIGGAGVDAASRGMAPGVLIRSYSSTNATTEMARDAALIDITNHSYGFRYGGWTDVSWNIPNGDGSFTAKTYKTWFHNTSIYYRDIYNEDPRYGRYDSTARSLDRVLHQNPRLLSFWSAGNERSYQYSNLQGDNKYVARFTSGFVPVNGIDLGGGHWLVSRDDYPSPGSEGYDTLASDKNAKNSIVVGSINDYLTDPHAAGSRSISSFQSFGPTDDGRLGVMIVANGESLRSANNSSDTAYTSKSGTSMSSPNAAGTAALLLEHWRNRTGGYTPLSSSQKALLMHTATDVINNSQVGPDYRTGYGLINALDAARFMDGALTGPETSRQHHFVEGRINNGQTLTFDFVSLGGIIKASLGWTDPEGPTTSGFDDRSFRALVNDLDLWISDSLGNIYRPWTLNPSNPSAPAVRTQRNDVDNFEQVYLDAGWIPLDQPLRLHIGIDGSLQGGGQDFSLLVSGVRIVPEPGAGAVLLIISLLIARRSRLTG